MTIAYEVLPHDGQQHEPSATALHWPRTRAHSPTPTVTGTLGWDLDLLGPAPAAAADLVRMAASAYLADRSTSRPTTFARTIDLTVHTIDPAPWNATSGRLAEELLAWLTGDAWHLHAVSADPGDHRPAPVPAADDVMLLSGGLDSLCGAADHLGDTAARIHLSHYDGSTVIRHAQHQTSAWLSDRAQQPLRHLSVKFHQTRTARERSSRSRSLLFAALASAVAAGAASPRVTVPENGFTSINPPLTAARGGALSTRSTHPGTFARINELLASLDVPVTVTNPYAYLTKGQLLARACDRAGQPLLQAGAATLSCSKLDGNWYPGGDPTLNCGLCLACLVRRGAFTQGPRRDPTLYLVGHLTGPARQLLLDRRRKDIHDVRQAIARGIDDTDILAVGDFPPDTDLDAVVNMCQRGLQELNHVSLP
ncbi:queuosine biosynthesis protein queC [Streptomyces sp. CB01373]|uniref:queuosine biosynthesis protein queC n=1 Tax=Streptomyces sp. CB01373 TaxID=2020325 RepID=UPI000C26E371|nr:queuosine biosynthesis protein queC [Streptomyces sp. CB01373]PJM91339.1 queuosine biosynthesis protein queC [Streptomyces sp. CB01373]